jgi:hypothetical protein
VLLNLFFCAARLRYETILANQNVYVSTITKTLLFCCYLIMVTLDGAFITKYVTTKNMVECEMFRNIEILHQLE